MYKIFGVVVCKKDDPDFLYHSFIDSSGERVSISSLVSHLLLAFLAASSCWRFSSASCWRWR